VPSPTGLIPPGSRRVVCATSGAPVSTVLHSLASALRDLHDADQARDSAYAGPLATARLLLALPPAGIALGMLLGADPLATLTGSTAGLLLLVAGLALTALGWWWMRRLTRQAAGHRTDEVDPSVTLDLVAGTLRAGLAPASALGTVGAALGSDPLGRSLSEFAGALRSGVPVPTALRHLPSSLEALGRSVLLSQRSGADLAQILHAAARDERRGRAREAEAAAARMAVRLVVPTGVALLPAFLVLGIIPTIASLLGGPLGGSLGGGFTTDVLTTG
jgi:tight adherence protein B